MTARLLRGRGGAAAYATLDVARTVTRARPDATNTGVPAGTSLTTWTGSKTFTTANQVITDRLFTISTTSSVIVNAPGVVFRRCRFDVTPPPAGQAGVYWPVDVRGQGVGNATTFVDCDFFGNGVANENPAPAGTFNGFAPSAAVLCNDRANGFRLIRCHITGMHDGVQLVGRNILVDSCYIHDLRIFYTGAAVSHNDCMQASNMGNVNVRIINNHMDGTTGHTCMQLCPNGPDTGFPTRRYENFLIAGNYFNGGGYSLSGYSEEFLTGLNTEVVNFAIRDNRFGLACLYGPSFVGRDPRISWSNNRWDATGTACTGLNNGAGIQVTAGQLIN